MSRGKFHDPGGLLSVPFRRIDPDGAADGDDRAHDGGDGVDGSEEEADGGGLPGPVLADEAEDAAGGQGEGEVAQRLEDLIADGPVEGGSSRGRLSGADRCAAGLPLWWAKRRSKTSFGVFQQGGCSPLRKRAVRLWRTIRTLEG